MLALAPPTAGPPPVPLTLLQDQDHPRVRRACRYREHVVAWATDGGVVTLGRSTPLIVIVNRQ